MSAPIPEFIDCFTHIKIAPNRSIPIRGDSVFLRSDGYSAALCAGTVPGGLLDQHTRKAIVAHIIFAQLTKRLQKTIHDLKPSFVLMPLFYPLFHQCARLFLYNIYNYIQSFLFILNIGWSIMPRTGVIPGGLLDEHMGEAIVTHIMLAQCAHCF